MIGKCKECGGRVISQGNLFYPDVVMRVCADCGHYQSAYKKRANKASTRRGAGAAKKDNVKVAPRG
jgi:ribosome-binding protein aMBF1 (putative translation factor)